MLMYILIAIVLVLLVVNYWFSFRAQKPESYSGTAPHFDIRQHLSGPILCEGVIYGPLGRVNSRFVADMNGEWDGETGTLAEAFKYADGGEQLRKWHLKMGENGHFTATADDIIGEGKGVQIGATVRLEYRIRLPEKAGGHVLDVTDWMYLMENGSIMNRSQMRKFGLKVAELVATMRPVRG